MPKSKSPAAKAANKKKSGSKSAGGSKSGGGMPVAVSTPRSGDNGVGITLSHREFVTSFSENSVPFKLMGNSAYAPGYDLNPANVLLFPWLSVIARGYEKYRFERVTFELVPRNPTTMSGSVYFGFDYDFDDSVASTEAELMVNRGAVSGDVWTPKQLNVDIKRLNEDVSWRYCQLGLRGEGTGRMVYGGFLMVGVSGTSAQVSFDLFVTYTVKLSLPGIHTVIANKSLKYAASRALPAVDFTGFTALPDVGPSLKRVSVSDTPISTYFDAASQVYKIADSASNGLLRFVAKPATTGATPESFAIDTVSSAVIYDSDGGVLDTNLLAVTGIAAGKTSPDASILWSTAGATSLLTWSVLLDAIRHTYPKAAYLVPYLQSLAGRVLDVNSYVQAIYQEL